MERGNRKTVAGGELKIRIMKKTSLIITAILLFACTISVFGQGKDDINVNYHRVPGTMADSSRTQKTKNTDYLDKISIGGTLGAQFGTYTWVEISPDIAYHFNEWTCVGVGGTYILYYDNYNKIDYHVGGARVFAEAHFLQYLGVHAAYQALNYELFSNTSIKRERIWSNNLLLGGGYYQRSSRVAMYFYALYNISNRPPEQNIYGNLLFKAGFSIFLR